MWVALPRLIKSSNRYPLENTYTVTLEGTNATGTETLDLGSSWTLIYSGPTDIDPIIVSTRSTYMPQQNFSNTIAYRSYRLLIIS